ncbi:unnamed protein product, partial [Brachionus calyciflorus]
QCKGLGEGNLYAFIEQQERKIKPSIKHVHTDIKLNLETYEVSFVPEIDSICKIDLEFADKYENILNGDSIKLNVKAYDFLIVPYPLSPFPINTRCSFDTKILRKFVKNVKIFIKPISSESEKDRIECELVLLEKDLYRVFFTLKTIERHIAEIYFGNQQINSNRPVKIDVFDVSKITAKMPSKIVFGELNTFTVDTSGAGEGNLEVIIKDGSDTLKAQLLKREKRKFEIGFLSERNTKHDIQVVFNGVPIKDSPFQILPEFLMAKSIENISDILNEDIAVMEGGPIENIQSGEKMWIIYDAQSSQYSDLQFLVIDESNFPIKHSKIQLEDGRWRVEFIPASTGVYKIQRVLQADNTTKIQTIYKINVVHFSTLRTVYGYKLYSKEDSVQLVFDAAEYKVHDILPQVKDPNDKILEKYECKYLSDYLAIKFKPRLTGAYQIDFFDRSSQKTIASSPYKLIVHEPLKEIIRSSGVYDLTRLTITAKNLVKEYKLSQFNVVVYDSQQNTIRNCIYFNKHKDLAIEFISRVEGLHKIYLYIDDDLVDDNPFFVYVNGETLAINTLSSVFSPFTTFKTSLNNISMFNSPTSSSNDLGNASNCNSRSQLDSTSTSNTITSQPSIARGSIICAKKNEPFHFVIHNRNLQGLCVYDPLNESVSFKLIEDDHENGSIIIIPKLEGTHKIVGLIEGRDFEAQLFVLAKPEYENLFEMDNYGVENVIDKPFVITLKETNLEVDVYDPFGERVDVRYSGDNLATFIPRTTGYFKIYISDYHGPILGSPFYALIHQQKQPSQVPYIESSGIRDSILNEEAKFIIRNKDLEIDVQITDPCNQNLVLRKKRTSQGFLQVFYTPESIGPHEIQIIKDGLKVSEEPIVIFASDPNKVRVENLKRESILNQIFSFNIDATQAGEGFIRVNIKDPKLNDILPEINELDDRKYLVSFIPEILGIYEFSLTFNKYHLVESPFKINIFESVDLLSNIRSKNNSNQDEDLLLLDTNHLVTDDQILNDSNIEYELRNWNQQINNSLNKIMESATQQSKRPLSPITDTSEEESSDSLIYRGETYIENVERLPDGTSHLLLRIEDSPDLIDPTNPNKARGRYKYRLKRIPLPESWSNQQGPETVDTSLQNDNSMDLSSENFAEDFDPELIAISEKNDYVKPLPSSMLRRFSNLEDIKEETETYSSSSQKSSSGNKRKESSKSKHFKIDSNDRSFDSCETMGDVVRSLTLSETESESEINVANENLVSKITREKQKKINLEKTVIIEENYVIEQKPEFHSKIPRREKVSTTREKFEKNLFDSEEKSKSSLDNEIKITTKEYGRNKPKKTEKIIVKQGLGDEKLSEKLKPEESIQYEYEQVIEDRSPHQTPEPDNKKNIQIENTQTKKTEYETKEKFQTRDNVSPNSVKTILTEKTVLITETEEDKIVETIENEKNIDEFSYSQKRGRQGKISSNLKNNLAQLAERLNPVFVDSDSEPLHSVTVRKKISHSLSQEPSNFNLKLDQEQSKTYVLNSRSEKDLSSSTPSSSSNNDNFIEYYKLQPNQLNNEIQFDNDGPKISYEPVDLNCFQTGEQFKSDETVSLNDLASFSKGLTSRVDESNKIIKSDDEDSLAEIEENFVITFKSPEENAPLVESELKPLSVKPSSPNESTYYKPIETLTTQDFFKPEPKSLDQIKAKFENKEKETKNENEKTRSESVGKLPKSKFEIYDTANLKSSDSDTSTNKKLHLSRLNSISPPKETEKSKLLDFHKKSDDESHREISTDSIEKGVKNLLNKYERNPSRDSTSREMTTDSLEPKPVRKLSQNIVELFDRKDSLDSTPRSRSSYRSKDSDNSNLRSSKSTHSSTRSELNDRNDDVFFLETKIESKQENISDDSLNIQDRVRKLSKIFNEKSENSVSDSPRSSVSSERKSRFESKIPKPEVKTREKKLSDSFRKFEEKSKQLYETPLNDLNDTSKDSGVKDLVFKYEKRPSQTSDDGFSTDSKSRSPTIKKIVSSLLDESKPDPNTAISETSSTSTKKFSSSSDATLEPPESPKEYKEEEKSIKKLISKYEIPKMLEDLLEPDEVFYVDTTYQKTDLDLAKKQSREHSVDHLFDKKFKERENVDKGVKRLVDIYEKKPSVTSFNESMSTDSLNSKTKTESKKLDNFINKYENFAPKDEPVVTIGYVKEVDNKNFLGKKEEYSNEKKCDLEIIKNVFHNDTSNLTAIVHIPGQTTVQSSVKKGSKIKATLKIDTTDELKFNVATVKGHKVPFRVKHENRQTILTFNYHRVVDFNVGILNKNENGFVPRRYKAQLELKITDDYNFKIVKRDNLELVPIEISKNSEHIYEISFEPSATSSYILQASKNDPIIETASTPASLVDTKENISQKNLLEYENLFKRTNYKNELEQLIKVLLHVEHPNPIIFVIKKSFTGQSVEFKPSYKPKNFHNASFNYETITDFSIYVQKTRFREDLVHFSTNQNEEILIALLEIQVSSDSEFEIIRKETQEPLKIYIQSKINDTYKISFFPKSSVIYTLKVNQLKSTHNNDKFYMNPKINQIIDRIPNELSIPNKNSDVKSYSSFSESNQNLNPKLDNLNNQKLICTVHNPKNLEINELPSTDGFSYIVNTRKVGPGSLKSHALFLDNSRAYVEQDQLDSYVYSVKVYQNNRTGPLKLFLDYVSA